MDHRYDPDTNSLTFYSPATNPLVLQEHPNETLTLHNNTQLIRLKPDQADLLFPGGLAAIAERLPVPPRVGDMVKQGYANQGSFKRVVTFVDLEADVVVTEDSDDQARSLYTVERAQRLIADAQPELQPGDRVEFTDPDGRYYSDGHERVIVPTPEGLIAQEGDVFYTSTKASGAFRTLASGLRKVTNQGDEQ